MHIHEQIKKQFNLSFVLFKNSANERGMLHDEEFELEVTPLGEIEIFSDVIAGVAQSICAGHLPFKHLKKLKEISVPQSIPNYSMTAKYPTIAKDIQNWEEIRILCIEYLEKN